MGSQERDREKFLPQSFQKGPALLTPSWHSSLQRVRK
jgi:hypothetical protein